MPLVSIIIPACNAEHTIERCVRSIFNNTLRDIECIVVINNCSDHTDVKCELLKQIYSNLIIIKDNVAGVSAARNLALNIASGDIVGFCDADDYYEKNAIDSIVKCFEDNRIDLLITRYNNTIINDNKIIKSPCSNKYYNQKIGASIARGLVINQKNIMGSVWNKFYKREIVKTIRFDESLSHCEDMHFNMQILKNEKLIILLADIITYNYVYNSESATSDVNRCFTKDGKLKYLFAIDKIQNDYAGVRNVMLECSYAMYCLSVQNYRKTIPYVCQQSLRKNILANMKSVLLLWKYGFIHNIKLLVKGFLILLRIK